MKAPRGSRKKSQGQSDCEGNYLYKVRVDCDIDGRPEIRKFCVRIEYLSC